MRKAALECIAHLVESHPRVVFIGSDLGAGVQATAMVRFPDRVLMEGIAEQHIVGMASGMALEGFVPYVHTIGTFLTRRALEQIIIDSALHSLPVRLIGSGGGMVYAPLGPTHQSIDDFALMRAIPGMTVVAPIDPNEMTRVLTALVDWPGPAYVRVGKGGEPNVTSTNPSPDFGSLRVLRKGVDALVFSTGAIGHEVLQAADSLHSLGMSILVAHVPVVAPLPEDEVLELLSEFDQALVVEEHLPGGGLWTAIIETVMRSGVNCSVRQASLPPKYANRYGSQKDHLRSSGLDAESLIANIAGMKGAEKYG